jgi:hypothetical protein
VCTIHIGHIQGVPAGIIHASSKRFLGFATENLFFAHIKNTPCKEDIQLLETISGLYLYSLRTVLTKVYAGKLKTTYETSYI